MDEIVGVVLFLLLLFGGIGGYVYYIHMEQSKLPPKPKKKLSQKKQEKLKRKSRFENSE